jgi:hypothetical protein
MRRLVQLLPVAGCTAAVGAGFLVHLIAGLVVLCVACFVLEWRYDRD